MSVPSNLEIAQAHTLEPIAEIAARYGLEPDDYDLYGRYKAKVDLKVIGPHGDGSTSLRPNGYLAKT